MQRKSLKFLKIFFPIIVLTALILVLVPVDGTSNGLHISTVHAGPLDALTEKVSSAVGSALSGLFNTLIDNKFVAGFVSIIGSMILSLFQIVLNMAQYLFNTAIDWTILDFSGHFSSLKDSIDAIWKIFRDLANIVMIGIFIYIAFAVMLNISNFAAEKYAVRVIIMALLINFSLFFTEVIIDISHLTAAQFNSMLEQEISSVSNTDKSISGLIMQQTGFTSAFGNVNLAKVRDAGKSQLGAVFTWITFTSILYIAMISAMLYGIILLISRAITLIFLMITSPLAFAAFMVPQMESHWKEWWSKLLRNAFFAPLFMLFLWATAKLIKNLNGSGKTLVDIIYDPKASSVEGLFNIILILGLFVGSMKLANSLSLTGTNLAESIAKKSFGKGMSWSGIGLAGRLGFSGVARMGRYATGLAKLDADQKAREQYLREHGNFIRRRIAGMRLAGDDKIPKYNADLRKSKLLKELSGKAGLNLGKGVSTYDKMLKEKGKQRFESEKAKDKLTRGGLTEAEFKEMKKLEESLGSAHDVASNTKSSDDHASKAPDTTPRASAPVQLPTAKTSAPVENIQTGTKAGGENNTAGDAAVDQKIKSVKEDAAKDAQQRAAERNKTASERIIEELNGIKGYTAQMAGESTQRTQMMGTQTEHIEREAQLKRKEIKDRLEELKEKQATNGYRQTGVSYDGQPIFKRKRLGLHPVETAKSILSGKGTRRFDRQVQDEADRLAGRSSVDKLLENPAFKNLANSDKKDIGSNLGDITK